MKMRILVQILVFAAVPGTGAASAAGLQGVWMREDGIAKVQIGPCGSAVCGTVVWLAIPAGPAKTGEKVFFDFTADGPNRWRGKAFNPEDGNTYTGKMELMGDKLLTTGCAMAGLVCKSMGWTRSN